MEQLKIEALVDYIDSLVDTISGSARRVSRDRLQEAVAHGAELDNATVPLGLIFGAASELESHQIDNFIGRLPTMFFEDILQSLDLLCETLLMISDSDLQASGVIASSILVQRTLPAGMAFHDRVLENLLELVDLQYQERVTRHGDVFAALRGIKEKPSFGELPRLLTRISDALEDIACEKDVFLDDPVELQPFGGIRTEAEQSADEAFRKARLQSGADIPMLEDELERVRELAAIANWSNDEALRFTTDLYDRGIMDSRTKIGLSLSAIADVIKAIGEQVEVPVTAIRIDDEPTVIGPYRYDFDDCAFVLHLGARGSVTSRTYREAVNGVIARLHEEKEDRETTELNKAIKRYETARPESAQNIPSIEEETADIGKLAAHLGLPMIQAYDHVAELYGVERFRLSTVESEGVSLAKINAILESFEGSPKIAKIEIDSESPGLVPFTVDSENGVLKLNANFDPLTDLTIDRCLRERSASPLPLAAPNEDRLGDYRDATLKGSIAISHNLDKFIDEFGLAADHAKEGFEVLIESCPALQENVSVVTMRIIIATINERIGPDRKIDLVTGFERELPGAQREDFSSIAWLSLHEEEDETLNMLTINYSYGEGNKTLPPLTDEMLLDWCRHFVATSWVTAEF